MSSEYQIISVLLDITQSIAKFLGDPHIPVLETHHHSVRIFLLLKITIMFKYHYLTFFHSNFPHIPIYFLTKNTFFHHFSISSSPFFSPRSLTTVATGREPCPGRFKSSSQPRSRWMCCHGCSRRRWRSDTESMKPSKPRRLRIGYDLGVPRFQQTSMYTYIYIYIILNSYRLCIYVYIMYICIYNVYMYI